MCSFIGGMVPSWYWGANAIPIVCVSIIDGPSMKIDDGCSQHFFTSVKKYYI